LKQELIGYAAMAEIPAVIINVQRLGPSTGRPTSPAQGDVMQARWGSHGDHGVIALSPSSVRECFDVTVKAVNFSERFRMPVILLLDEVIGHMREGMELPAVDQIKIENRKQPTVGPDQYEPFRPDADGIPPMAEFGQGYRYHVTGLVHDYHGMPIESDEVAQELIDRLHTKIERARNEITLFDEYFIDDAEVIVIAFGASALVAIDAVKSARERGVRAGLLKLITIWPFPSELVSRICQKAKTVIVPEMNYGQLVGEIKCHIPHDKVVSVRRYDGSLFKPEQILGPILAAGCENS
jgi:2-oxoglutarate ferredoxin oxidoreductase subunit alpha